MEGNFKYIDKKYKILYIVSEMKYLNLVYIIILLTILSCKTIEPIVYDKNLPKINKELFGINLMIRQGEFDDADKRLEQALVLYPENKDLKTVKCFLLIEQNKNREANELIDSFLSQMPENALLYTAKGMLEVKNSKFDKALEYFEKSITLSNSRLASPWFQKGLLFYRQSNYEKASECFFKAKQIDFRNPDFIFFYFLSQLYITKNLEANIHLWKSAENRIAEIPSWYYSFYTKALYDIDCKEDALKLMNEGLKKYPNDLYLQLFDCCVQLDDAKKKGTIPDAALGDKIRQILFKLPCPETADAWIIWLDMSNDERLAAECRKYTALYSYSPLTQFWSQKITNKD